MIVDVLLKHGGLPNVLPLAVHLSFFARHIGLTILNLSYSYSYSYVFMWDPSFMLKPCGVVGGGWPTAF